MRNQIIEHSQCGKPGFKSQIALEGELKIDAEQKDRECLKKINGLRAKLLEVIEKGNVAFTASDILNIKGKTNRSTFNILDGIFKSQK